MLNFERTNSIVSILNADADRIGIFLIILSMCLEDCNEIHMNVSTPIEQKCTIKLKICKNTKTIS